eukprot:1161034-Pelagomonas_calceolata.AAC.11
MQGTLNVTATVFPFFPPVGRTFQSSNRERLCTRASGPRCMLQTAVSHTQMSTSSMFCVRAVCVPSVEGQHPGVALRQG